MQLLHRLGITQALSYLSNNRRLCVYVKRKTFHQTTHKRIFKLCIINCVILHQKIVISIFVNNNNKQISRRFFILSVFGHLMISRKV